MAAKKAVKKVEIAEESMLNLKASTRKKIEDSGQKIPVSFNIHRIEDDETPSIRHVNVAHHSRDDSFLDRVSRAPISTNPASEVMEPEKSRFDQDELHKRMESFAEKLEQAVIKVSPQDPSSVHHASVAAEPKDLIKVKFEKFVQLVATKDFLSILERNKDEDIVMSSNLLTELASAVEEKGERKSPVIFLVGLAIGVIVTYLLISH